MLYDAVMYRRVVFLSKNAVYWTRVVGAPRKREPVPLAGYHADYIVYTILFAYFYKSQIYKKLKPVAGETSWR